MNFIPLLDSVLESTIKTNLGVNGKPRLPVHKDQNEVTLMKWPAQSLDLNIKENIFSMFCKIIYVTCKVTKQIIN